MATNSFLSVAFLLFVLFISGEMVQIQARVLSSHFPSEGEEPSLASQETSVSDSKLGKSPSPSPSPEGQIINIGMETEVETPSPSPSPEGQIINIGMESEGESPSPSPEEQSIDTEMETEGKSPSPSPSPSSEEQIMDLEMESEGSPSPIPAEEMTLPFPYEESEEVGHPGGHRATAGPLLNFENMN